MSILFWDVDTQRDFIEPTGRLYAQGAEKIKPNLATLTRIGAGKVFLSGSVDAHLPDDPEFDAWPMHCVYGTPGQQKVPESRAKNILFIPSVQLTNEQLREALEYRGQVIFEKQSTDIRANPNVRPFIELLHPETVYVYGVVTEICVNYAVDFFAHELGYRTMVVIDAIKELEPTTAKACLSDWETMGVELVTTENVKQTLADM